MEILTAFWQSCLSVIKTITIFDVLDILIVAFLIYKLIQLLRETRAEQLVKGIIVLGVAYLFSAWLGLRTMSFLLVNLANFGIIAVVVVFQPELRKLLEQVGRAKIGSVFASREDGDDASRWEHAIDAICEACVSLSKQKIGALIVCEKQTKLGDIIRTGTIINADPSPESIGNIFFPNSPLHDGAMIIRDGRMHAAGCFLPLSENYTISRELGTRHRAALGMSENSDAVVLVVSEETGVITVAQNGTLKRNFDFQMLKATLERELIPEPATETAEKRVPFWKVKRR